MPKPTFTVRAVGIAKIQHVDESGRHTLGRYAGRNAKGEPTPEAVPSTGLAGTYYQRAIQDGELEIVAPAPIAPLAPDLATQEGV